MWFFDVSVCASRRFISGDVVDVWHCVVVQSSKSLTPAVYDSVGALFRDRYGANCGWAHSLLFAAELPFFRAVIAAGGPTSSGGAMTSARGDDLSAMTIPSVKPSVSAKIGASAVGLSESTAEAIVGSQRPRSGSSKGRSDTAVGVVDEALTETGATSAAAAGSKKRSRAAPGASLPPPGRKKKVVPVHQDDAVTTARDGLEAVARPVPAKRR